MPTRLVVALVDASSDIVLTPTDLPEGVELIVATGYPAIAYARFMSWDGPQLRREHRDERAS